MRTVIILNGPPKVGKDTIANTMAAMKPIYREKFAEPIKSAVAAFLGLTPEERHHFFETPAKDEVSSRFFDTTPRSMLISFSEDWVKPNYGKDAFGVLLGQRIVRDDKDFVVVTDGGFDEELLGLIETAGPCTQVRVVRLERDGTSFAGDSRKYLANPYMTVYNNGEPTTAAAGILSEFMHG